ncbi:hypothetical protein V5799_014639 [Amblyomma americanum]|uniref:Uncharacterized protein n=1 Tax=Amblyomma americanum TaxID=6943 RepID=A0AAQ4E2F9_AMBAM
MKISKTSRQPIHKAARFLSVCLSVTNSSDMDSLKEVLARANITWPNSNSKPDFLNSLFYVSLDLMSNVFFNIKLVRGESGHWRLYLTFSDSAQRLHKEFLRQIKTRHLADHLREMYRAFGKLNESRLNEMLRHYVDMADLFEQFSRPLRVRRQLANATRLLEYFPSVPAKRWNDVLTKRANVSLNELDGLVTNEPDNLHAVSSLHQKRGEELVNELVEVLAVQSLIIFADFALLSSFYQDSQLAMKDVRRKCFTVTNHMYGYAINDLYRNVTRKGERFVKGLAEKLRRASPAVLIGNASLSGDSDQLPAKTKHLDIALRTLQWSRPKEYMALYANQPELTDSPLRNYVLASAYLKSLPYDSERKSAIVERSDKTLPMFWDFRPTIDYFHYPFYAPDASLSVLYAGIGTRLAASLFFDYVERKSAPEQVGAVIHISEAVQYSVELAVARVRRAGVIPVPPPADDRMRARKGYAHAL